MTLKFLNLSASFHCIICAAFSWGNDVTYGAGEGRDRELKDKLLVEEIIELTLLPFKRN